MVIFFSILVLITTVFSLLAILSTIRLTRYVRNNRNFTSSYQPTAAVIIPCYGVSPTLSESINVFLSQNYPSYELILVTESKDDPAYKILKSLIANHKQTTTLLIAGNTQDCAQKVHNQTAALDYLSTRDDTPEVLVFADDDAIPTTDWLKKLVSPLNQEGVGATTGYRWYLPVASHPLSLLLSIWNSFILQTFGARSMFAWGGSLAIRYELFNELNIREKWHSIVSDDIKLSQVVNSAKYSIKFVPAALVSSISTPSFSELLRFSRRQILYIRVYAPKTWIMFAIIHGIMAISFWGGLVIVVLASFFDYTVTTTLMLGLATIFSLRFISGLLRVRIVKLLLPRHHKTLQKHFWYYGILDLFGVLLNLWVILATVTSRRVIWGSIEYKLISSNKTVIIRRF